MKYIDSNLITYRNTQYCFIILKKWEIIYVMRNWKASNPNIWWLHPTRLLTIYSIRADATALIYIHRRALATFCRAWLFSNPKCTPCHRRRQIPSSSYRVKNPSCMRIQTPYDRWTFSFDSFWIDSVRKIYKFCCQGSDMPTICRWAKGSPLASSASLDRQYILHRLEYPIPKCAYSCRRMW